MPLDWRLASPDASDDGIGRSLWDSLAISSRAAAAIGLAQLLDTELENDAPTVFARALLQDVPAELPDQRDAAVERGLPTLGRVLFGLIGPLLTDADGPQRLEVIRELATLLHFAAVLGLILEGVARDSQAAVGDALSLVVYTGVPPGGADDSLVRAAQRSLRVTIERTHAGLRNLLAERLRSHMDDGIPHDVRLRSALLAALREGGSPNPKRAMAQLTAIVPVNPADEADAEGWAKSAMEVAYSVDDLQRAIRAFGNKVGFTAPNRGFGQPRFVAETPLLATITRTLIPVGSSLPFDQFVREARERIGLVFGISGLETTLDALPPSADVFGSPRRAWEHLSALQERLRQRLIRAGIAREFSDGHTQVFRS